MPNFFSSKHLPFHCKVSVSKYEYLLILFETEYLICNLKNYKVSQKNWTLLLLLQVVTSSFFLGHLVLCMICTVLNCHITCSIFTNQNCVCRVLKRIGGHWLKRQVDGDKFIWMDNLLLTFCILANFYPFCIPTLISVIPTSSELFFF